MKSQTREMIVGVANSTGTLEEDVEGRDNRNLNNNSDAQKLTAEEIEEMKKNGSTGFFLVSPFTFQEQKSSKR